MISGGRSLVNASFLNPEITRDLSSEVLGPDGRLRVLPAEYWAGTTRDERALFGHRHGIYSFPTVELVERLRVLIAGRSAIEIGSGHGVLADALGIPGTDNRMQEQEKYRRFYEQNGQPTVKYGPNIIECDARQAVRRFRPDVVIGCWVTHKYDPARHAAGGNEIGIDEEDVIRNCVAYVVIGNERVHDSKKIWTRRHTIEYPPFVFSRSSNGSRDFIAKWTGSAKRRRKPKKLE